MIYGNCRDERGGLLRDDVNEEEHLIMICQEQLNRPPRVFNGHAKVTSVHRNSVIRQEDRESQKLIKNTTCVCIARWRHLTIV